MPKMINAFILDDEIKSISNLKNLIAQYCPHINVIETSQSPLEAFKLVKKHKPDVLFLDIEMPKINGFDFLNLFHDIINFKVVFVTAYNQFAIDAIKVNALDYLLKPISIQELIKTESKLVKVLTDNKVQTNTYNSQLIKLLDGINEHAPIQKLILPSDDGFIIKPLNEITYFKSENNYTHMYCQDGKVYLISKTLKNFEKRLDNTGFFRVHNSFLVNTLFIEKLVKQDGGYVIMKGGDKIIVSRRRMANLQELLKLTFKTL